MTTRPLTRRRFFAAAAAAGMGLAAATAPRKKALVSVTLDLEMSAEYPRRGMTEWNYQKGNLDDDTKRYAVEAAKRVKAAGGALHFFCVGQTLEQPDVGWLKGLAAAGHPIGNHTYDHVNVKAKTREDLQFRFRRSPWLLRDLTVPDAIRDNVRLTTVALKERCGVAAAGFRTPGGFADGLADRPDVRAMLRELGFDWVSSKYPAHAMGKPGEAPTEEVFAAIVKAQESAQPFAYPDGMVEVPMSPVSDVVAFRTHRWKLPDFLKAVRLSVGWAVEHGGVFDFLAHPSCLVVEDPKFDAVGLIAELVKAAGARAAFADLGTVAATVTPPPKRG